MSVVKVSDRQLNTLVVWKKIEKKMAAVRHHFQRTYYLKVVYFDFPPIFGKKNAAQNATTNFGPVST